MRRALRLGTCLSGTAAALMLMMPVAVRAADACGAPVDGVVTCPVSDVGYPDGIDYIVDPAVREDLTVNLGDGLTIDTGDSDNNGIHVGNLNGAVTINAAGTSITTSGVGATAMSGVTYVGDLTMHAGNIATSGYQGHGIVGSASQGDVTITAGSVSTTGDLSYGISVLADAPNGGNVAINVDSVSTAGVGSKGIEVFATAGDVAISAGSVSTTGDDATAIQAIAGGNLSIAAETISTTGTASHGIAGVSLYGDMAINAGSISTAGNHAVGVYALSLSGDTNVTIGDVTTSGYQAAGIIAQSANGSTTVTVGDVRTDGYGSNGIYAYSGKGDTVVNAGNVDTIGSGIEAISTTGKATVNVNDVYAFGNYASGVVAIGASAEVNVSGQIVTHGYGSNGIVAIAQAGDASVRADDKVITTYPGAVAILAVANGDTTVDANKVYTNAPSSTGIVAVGYGGDVNVSVNNVGAKGNESGGILAIAAPTDPYYDMAGHDITVTAGTITTDGAGPRAAGIVAINSTVGGNTNVTVTESVSTRRDYAQAVYAYSQSGTATVNVKDASTRGFGATAINADGATASIRATGAISTLGDFSSAIRGYGSTGGVTITSSGVVSTSGKNSYGLLAHGFGPLSITNSGTIQTSGTFGHGIYAIASPGATSSVSIVNSGAIAVTGDRANGVKAVGKGVGATVVSTGTVTVSGDRAIGILAVGDRGGRGGDRLETAALADKTVRVDAASVTATGDSSVGILAANYNGDLVINSTKLSANGAGSGGITTMTVGTTKINVGSVASSSMAINSAGFGDIDITVSGAVGSNADTAIVATSQGGNATVNIGAGGSVVGGGHRVPVYIYGGNGITLASWYGDATVNNAGFVTTKGDGYAIEVIGFSYQPGRRAIINNSGRIDGAVHVTQLDDIFVNSGTFNVTKDSNFDLGNDLFTNTGTVRLVGAKASFLGLEKFDNKGGLVDLTNGRAGDVFTLDGNYVGSGDARLALDLKGATADNFVVAGAATGKTKVMLTQVGGANATLTGGKSIALIKVGAGSAAGAFTLASSNIGFIQYGLDYNAASGTYGLIGTAGSAVYRGLKVSEGAAAAWHQSGDVWTAHMAGLRDSAAAGGEAGRKLWGQAYGQVDSRDEVRDIVGTPQGHDLGYKQNHVGGQLGYELGQRGRFAFGVTAGYLKSTLDFSGADEELDYGVANFGGYAGYKAGSFFASALVKYDRFRVAVDSEELGYSDEFTGSGYGAQVEAGARFGSAALFVEPVASLAWHTTDLGDLKALGQSVEFDAATGLRGKIGAKVGGSRRLASGSSLIFYGGANLVHEFAGEDGVTLVSGGTSEHVGNAAIKTYGQGLLGLSLRSAGRVSGFVEGNANFGGDYKGGGGRVGLSIKL